MNSMMTKDAIIEEAKKLSLADRQELAAVIEESIAEETDEWGLTPEQEAEIFRRLDEYERDPSIALTQEQFDEQLDRALQ